MDVDCGGSGFDGGEAVMVVQWVEQAHVEDGADIGEDVVGEGDLAAGGGVDVAFGPSRGAWNDGHAVGAEGVEFADGAVEGDGFDVGVAGDEEVAEAPGFGVYCCLVLLFSKSRLKFIPIHPS